MKGKWFSHVRLFATPWTVAYQVPPSVGFSRQEYWGGLPFPSPGDLLDPGIWTQVSHIGGRHFTIWATREEHLACHRCSLNEWVKYSSIWESQKGVRQDYKHENLALRLLCKHLCFPLPSQSVLEKTTPEKVDGDCVRAKPSSIRSTLQGVAWVLPWKVPSFTIQQTWLRTCRWQARL